MTFLPTINLTKSPKSHLNPKFIKFFIFYEEPTRFSAIYAYCNCFADFRVVAWWIW
jgi:hypothetical protein